MKRTWGAAFDFHLTEWATALVIGRRLEAVQHRRALERLVRDRAAITVALIRKGLG